MSTTPNTERPTSNPEATWNRISELNRLLFQACLREARGCGDVGNFEDLMQWCSVAAWSASGQGWFGELSSRELEGELIRVAQQLPVPTVKVSPRSRPRWLHVLTEAYATLGHTNLCRRWIQYDPDVAHDVLLLAQNGAAPTNLAEAVTRSGGQCLVLDPTTSLLQRAAELRSFAWGNADVVVLHTHPDEVMATVAFGVAGGPVVVMVNHADHVFWVGGAVADLILEIRMSGHLWTKQLRGMDRTTILPIPIAERESSAPTDSWDERQTVRKSLGIPEDAVMLLTVGSAAKFEAVAGLDFVATAKEIVQACPNTYLVAIGPTEVGTWKAAKEATGGRILPIGYQQDSTLFCRAADLYLEGFPLGSLTALLEAGQAGLMCVRAPLDSPMPFCSDSLSLDHIPQTKDPKDYVRTVVALVKDFKARTAGGETLQRSIESQHCQVGWLARLREIRKQLPTAHLVYREFQPVAVANTLRNWFLRFTYRKSPAQTRSAVALRIWVEAWKRTNARPKLDAQLWAELEHADLRRIDDAVARGQTDGSSTALKLWRLNWKIARLGSCERSVSRANVALHAGKPELARRMIYHGLWTSPSCMGNSRWLQQFVKVHLAPEWRAKIKSLLSRRSR